MAKEKTDGEVKKHPPIFKNIHGRKISIRLARADAIEETGEAGVVMIYIAGVSHRIKLPEGVSFDQLVTGEQAEPADETTPDAAGA